MNDYIKWPDEVYEELVEKVQQKELAKLEKALKKSINDLKDKPKAKSNVVVEDLYKDPLDKYQPLPKILANIPTVPDNRKIIHWTGHTESYSCQSCGKPRLTNSPEIWMVMKKSWLTHDPNFVRCVEIGTKWDIKTGLLTFVGAPAINSSTGFGVVRNNILDAIKFTTPMSASSRTLTSILSILENSTAGLTTSLYDHIKLSVPKLLQQEVSKTSPCRPYLLQVLKIAYLNSY